MSARRRSKWFGWIPAIVLAVILAGVGIGTAVMLGNGLGQPAPAPTEGQVTDLNWSSFTPAGLDYIADTRQVRIDVSSPPVDAAAIGLAPDDTLVLEPINVGDTDLDYDLIVNGGGEGPGGGRFIVSEISIETANGVVTHITAPLSEVLNFRQTLNLLIKKADTWGWDTSGKDAIYDAVEDATRAGEPYEFTFGPADKAGVPVSATASCDTTGYCLVTYDVAPAS